MCSMPSPPRTPAPPAPRGSIPPGAAPAYEVPQELAEAVAEKQKSDNTKTAELIARGVPTAPITTGTDGGMNAAFQARYKTSLVRLADGKVHTMVEERGGAPASSSSDL